MKKLATHFQPLQQVNVSKSVESSIENVNTIYSYTIIYKDNNLKSY